MRRVTIGFVLLMSLLLAACGASQSGGVSNSATVTAAPAATADGMVGMDHGSVPMANSNAPYDAQFIDSMIMHHQGAIEMANQAIKQGERQEIKDLAANVVKAQEAEIAQMRAWRTQWYPDLADTGGMGMSMGEMMVSTDTSTPFDQRFIKAMTPHHQSAVEMARDAQGKAEHSEIKTLASNIITDQEKEIAQMQEWQKAWFGQ